MSLPAGVTTCNVIFNTPLSFAGGTGTATLTVRPTQTIIWAATGQPLGAFSDTVTTSAQPGSMALPVVDQPGFVDSAGNTVTNWAYTADVLWTVGTQNLSTHKSFQLLTGQTSVTFDLIPDGNTTIAVTAPTATVTSVNGATGPITLDSASVGLSNVDNTSDANKPLSTAATNALALKQDAASLDTTNAGLVNDSASATAAALNATYATHGTLDPLQPRGLTVRKLGIVLPVGTAAWENWLVESPSVVFDPITQQWLMVYTGYSTNAGAAGNASAGLATSLDGVNWTRTGTAILQGTGNAGDPDQYGTTGPSLWIENGTYNLFYIGLDATGYEGGTKRMMLATATSLSGPWTRKGVMIAPSGIGWRSTSVYHRSIVKYVNNKYYMFFNAYGNGGFERTGYATATSILGPWTVDDVNSPLIDVGAAGAWDSQIAGDPSVYRVGDMWYMAYYGYNGTNAQDGVAFTSNAAFPLGWTKHPQNPILKIGAAGSIDDTHAHKPCIVQTPGAIYHYYTAVGAGQPTTAMRSIALAVDSPATVATSHTNPAPVVDTFNRPADSATDLGVSTTGQQWRNDAGIVRNVSSHAEPVTLVSGQAVASLDAGFTDGKTAIRILSPATAGASIGLICRMIDATNFVWADIDTNGISIVKRVNGTDTILLAKVPRTIAASDIIRIDCYANTTTAWHNGVWIGTGQDNFCVTGTRRGLRFYAGGGATVDDLSVTPF